jgi:hypothetical protein
MKKYHTSFFNNLRYLLILFFLTAAVLQALQTAEAKNLSPKEKEWQSCEGGHYTGPREGRRSYSNDKYLWVVTPAFAKRFCMPPHMISNELKGAEAIAFRMVDGADNDRCGVNSKGETHCTENSTARFEIYLPQSLNLPAANPQVKFFYGEYKNSDRQIDSINEKSAVGDRMNNYKRYMKGEYKLPEGRTPHFSNPYAHPDPGHRFGLIYAHEGKVRWPIASLPEVGFRGDWIKGMDMLVLQNELGVFFGFEMDHYKASKIEQGNEQGQYLIVMDKRNDFRKDSEKNILIDYAHVIHLPHQFGQKIRQAGMNKGGNNWQEFIKKMNQ